MEAVKVDTVNAFQGCEKQLIIISTVKSNMVGDVRFISDPKQINVALTRAQCNLVVVGDSSTLRQASVWADWLKQTVGLHHCCVRPYTLDPLMLTGVALECSS